MLINVGSAVGVALREFGLGLMKTEIVKVEMAPAAAMLVDEAKDNLFALVRQQINRHRLEVFGFIAAGAKDYLAVVLTHQFNAGFRVRAAGHQKTGEWVRHCKG